MKVTKTFALLFLLHCFSFSLEAQRTPVLPEDSTLTTIQQIPSKYLSLVSSKTADLESKLDKKTEKAVAAVAKQEMKLKNKLQKTDSLLAHSIFDDAAQTYKSIEEKLATATSGKVYIPFFDTLKTSLKFLEQNPSMLVKTKKAKEKLAAAMSKVKGLEKQFQKAEEIKKFLKERKQYLKEQLSKLGFAKQLKKINKQVYYFSQQIAEFKEIFKDSKKAEKKAIELLSKTKLFQDFIRKNSMLASFFPMPGDGGLRMPGGQTGFAGLQTRIDVLSFIQGQSGTNIPVFASALQKNIQSAQGIVNQLRSKLNSGGGGDLEMPDFKPNNQRTKSLRKRLEISSNLQTQKSNFFFPTTTDFGFSIGYKLNDENRIGLGSSIKIGWGKNIRQIKISGEGLSLRSFIDIKIKNSFYASGGFEYNYQQSFNDVRHLYNISAWKHSGLIGLSKVVSLKGKFLKKTKIQLLYDFFYREKLPLTEPVKFRIGYIF